MSLRTLLPHVRPGGLYVVEDVEANLKPDKGEDIWPDFLLTMFQRMRSTKAPINADASGSRLALNVFKLIDDVILGAQTVTLRRAERK